jgi:hypothetical protein
MANLSYMLLIGAKSFGQLGVSPTHIFFFGGKGAEVV